MTREDAHTEHPRTGQPDAWTTFVGRHSAGDLVQAIVTKTLPFGSLVEAEGVPGLLTGAGNLTAGDRVEAPIVALDQDRRRFSMSR